MSRPLLLNDSLLILRRSALVVLWTHLAWTKWFSVGTTVGASMLPTISVSGQWVVISKFHTRARGVRVGDLVSYVHPVDGPDVNVIKRVIGLPGDFVVADPTAGTGEMLQVPKGHMWTTGDNLPHSLDSRKYGPVPLALVRGKVVAKGRPWEWVRNPLVDE